MISSTVPKVPKDYSKSSFSQPGSTGEQSGRFGPSRVDTVGVTIRESVAIVDVKKRADVFWQANSAGSSSESRDLPVEGSEHQADEHAPESATTSASTKRKPFRMSGNRHSFAIPSEKSEEFITLLKTMDEKTVLPWVMLNSPNPQRLSSSRVLRATSDFVEEKTRAGAEVIRISMADIKDAIQIQYPNLYNLETSSCDYRKLSNVLTGIRNRWEALGESDEHRLPHRSQNPIEKNQFIEKIKGKKKNGEEVTKQDLPRFLTQEMLNDPECPPPVKNPQNRAILSKNRAERREFVFKKYENLLKECGFTLTDEHEQILYYQCGNIEKDIARQGQPQQPSSTAKKAGELDFEQIGSGCRVDIFAPPQSTVTTSSKDSEVQASISRGNKMLRLDAASFSTEATSVTDEEKTAKPLSDRGKRLETTLGRLKNIAEQQSAETSGTSSASKRTDNSDVQSSRYQAVAASHQSWQKSQQELEEYRKAQAKQSRGNPDEPEDVSVNRLEKAKTPSKLYAK